MRVEKLCFDKSSAKESTARAEGRRRRSGFSFLLLLVAMAVAAVGCSSSETTADDSQEPAAGSSENASDSEDAGSEDADSEDAGSQFPVTIDSAVGEVVIEQAPTTIVSLSPTATEMAFAIGAGAQIAAVDTYSNYPPEAPEGTLDGFAPDLEAILALSPDLVLTSGLPEDVSAGLTGAGVPVLVLPAAASFDDTYDQIGQLGIATGQIDGAAEANAALRSGIEEILADLPESDEPVKVFHEIDDSFYTATSNSFIGQVYATLGLENIADPLDDGSGFPLVDGESIIAADPGLIVFTSQASYSADDIVARPGWESISAVTDGRVVQVDADIASRWGPRIVEFMQAIVDTLVPA